MINKNKLTSILILLGIFLVMFLFGGVVEAAYSNWVNSSDLEILNTLPTVTLTDPADNNWTTNRTPTFSWSGNDADGDSMTYQLNLTCYPTCSVENRLINESSSSHTIVSYLKYLKDDNYYYNWSVRASDDSGTSFGNWSEIRKIEIQSYILVTLINDTVSFGGLTMDSSYNTTTNDPWPFWLQNDGNVEVDIDINATNLWNTILNPSVYYRYKVDNKTGEEGSFDWGQSVTAWQNMPNSTQETAIVNFSWFDATDSAEVDLLVSVPNDEGSGNRESLIVFEASLSDGGASVAYTDATAVYRFENGALTTDSSGNSKTLTSNGNPAADQVDFIEGAASVDLDGSGDYYSRADASFNAGGGDYSVAFWFWQANQDGEDIIGKKTDGGAGWVVHIDTGNWDMRIQHGEEGVGTTFDPADNTWYHVVIAFDQDAANELQVWVSTESGTFGDTLDSALNMDSDPENSGDDLMIGNGYEEWVELNGGLDEVAVFIGTVLTAEQAEDIWDGSWRP